MKKRKKIIILICIATFLVWMLYTNLSVAFTYYAISFDSLPKSFEGFKIAHISDFHNAKFGNAAESIVDGIKEEKPDIIAITGDLIDSSNTNVEVALDLVKGLVEIAPCYYVTGNHESWVDNGVYQILEDKLTEYGVPRLPDNLSLSQLPHIQNHPEAWQSARRHVFWEASKASHLPWSLSTAVPFQAFYSVFLILQSFLQTSYIRFPATDNRQNCQTDPDLLEGRDVLRYRLHGRYSQPYIPYLLSLLLW